MAELELWTPNLLTIAGSEDNTVWGIDRDNNPVRWIPSANSWEWPGGVGTPTSVKATQIAVGRRNFVVASILMVVCSATITWA